jgi:ATP-dependent Clp protease, protease subunit
MTRTDLTRNGPAGRSSRLAFRVVAQAADAAEIMIYDEIGEDWFGEGITAKNFRAELADLGGRPVNVRINSIGGSVFEGNAMYNALRDYPGPVETHIDGLAASIASIIALGGRRVHIAENAFLMIHNPHGMALGESDDMRKMADTLDTVKGSLVGVYAKRTGKDPEVIAQWMDEETWFSATEAKAHGFVDEITEAQDYKLAASLEGFGKLPAALRALAEEPTPEPAPEVAPDVTVGPSAEMVALAAESMRTLHTTRP